MEDNILLKGVYTPRYTQDKAYHGIFKNHWEGFLSLYKNRFEKEYGKIEEYQKEIVEKFIVCGDPEEGFAYLQCPKCGEAYIVPFSCKSKVCNCCGIKKSIIWSTWAAQELLLDCNHRHITLTIPIILRQYFYRRPILLKKYLETACDLVAYAYTRNCLMNPRNRVL
jgi:hypothetical protein